MLSGGLLLQNPEALKHWFSVSRLEISHGTEESDTMQLSLQITWHRQQKPVETCFKLTKKNMSCFPMETPISNQGETCGYLPLSEPKPALIKIGTTANMQPPLVPETPGLGAPKSTAPRCKAMFFSHKIDTWHFARRRGRPEALSKKAAQAVAVALEGSSCPSQVQFVTLKL